MSVTQRARRLVLSAAVLLFATAPLCAEDVPAMARWDWHFRESLRAIRDWEAILAAWEQATPKEHRTPVLPVPVNGDAVDWPNPIPRMLLPPGDRAGRVWVRLADGAAEVVRTTFDGNERQRRQTRSRVKPGDTVVGCKHPGGGGRSRWYHRYHRRFDGLTCFRPVPAPFAVGLETPLDLRRGANKLSATFRNVTGQPLTLTVRLVLRGPPSVTRENVAQERTIRLAARSGQVTRWPVELKAPGGRLLQLTMATDSQSYWLPLFTHVEDIPAVLKSVEQILAESGDAADASRLRALAAQVAAAGPGAEWRALFEQACGLRDRALLRRVQCDALLFIKRKPYDSEQPFMDAHHCVNRPGGAIWRLAPVRPGGNAMPLVDSLGTGIYRDLCLHWDADRFLFAFGNGSDRGPEYPGPKQYDIFEARANGSGLRRLTSHRKNDAEPFYLPDGQIAFTSDRSGHIVMCGSNIHAPTLHVMKADGSSPRQLSFNVFNDINPCIMPDGRILYTRWEYNERSVTTPHKPFTMNPDGSMVEVYYGNATIRPNVVMYPRPVPGSRKIMGLFTAHHGQTHGPIALIDTARGLDGPEPFTILTPGVPNTGEKHEDSFHGWFSDPMPLSEDTYLCSFTPTCAPWLEDTWALYVGDRHGNLALVYRDPAISCFEPVPLVRRPKPHVREPAPPDTDSTRAEATLLVLDAHVGLPGVPRGTVKFLRILEDLPRVGVPEGGVIVTSGTAIYTVKRIHGIVPVEPDGSAHFVVPANRNVYFEALDAAQQEIQRMRSVVCLKPDERRACVGCHEPRTTSPPNAHALAIGRDPSRPVPPPFPVADSGGLSLPRALSFLRDVQPVLNGRCVDCHTHDRVGNRVILTDDLTDQFTIAYEELLPYLSVANAMRWDHPDDVYPRPPYTYGSRASRLMTLLADHHDVRLTEDERLRLVNWTDANAVYYDRYEHIHPQRRIFLGDVRKALDNVHGRRCASCHGRTDGRRDTWWLTLNRRDARLSRALMAPLAKEAGGWARCDGAVFASAEDPDYQKVLGALATLRKRLAARPRADLLSIRGTPAETQKVAIPPPPPPRKLEDSLPDGWVWLSDLEWQTGKAGWTHNGDGLPRRDRDVEDNRLRLGGRRYRKGIGTHAPSEIVYRLDGRYQRFRAIVGGGEDRGTVVFQVFGDGEKLFESGTMHGLKGTKTADVPLAGVRTLRLVVTIAGDNYNADMATWAAARLHAR